MMERKVTWPELALIAGTRMAMGVGIGLLLSGRLNRDQRKAAGLSLALVGAITTVPLFVEVFCKKNSSGEVRAIA